MDRSLAAPTRQPLLFSGAESLFPDLKQSLGQSRLSAELQGSYRRGIDAYSDFCRRHRLAATVETARRFMAESARLESLAARRRRCVRREKYQPGFRGRGRSARIF